ncbi:hypothetical protein [Hymenobacter convexus]|uniref:hypothetical protein n=1 Tax=Hymenobacter sp. CA1UV-4 TaxID=3063782 RepID=UPI0027127AD2|nr:hypothetical protein [Hymenobacter sp. CA1UV-4]MDO7850577.1 hypothetical protein [Hymenobacter sp. CA1UV-4]
MTTFPSYWEFAVFEAVLHEKLAQQKLFPWQHLPFKAPNDSDTEQLYRCPACGEIWALSQPDNAWRGYFLPQQKAETYRRKLHRQDFAKGLIGGVCLLALIVFSLWKLLG